MPSIKTEYSAPQSLTITMTSMADNTARQSGVVSNTSDKYLDALVQVKLKVANSGSVSTPQAAVLYAYASANQGTNYTDGATGSDASFTLNSLHNLKAIGIVYASAINATYHAGPFSVASAFGGRLPEKWGVVLHNDVGTFLSGTEADHSVFYQGIYASSL